MNKVFMFDKVRATQFNHNKIVGFLFLRVILL